MSIKCKWRTCNDHKPNELPYLIALLHIFDQHSLQSSHNFVQVYESYDRYVNSGLSRIQTWNIRLFQLQQCWGKKEKRLTFALQTEWMPKINKCLTKIRVEVLALKRHGKFQQFIPNFKMRAISKRYQCTGVTDKPMRELNRIISCSTAITAIIWDVTQQLIFNAILRFTVVLCTGTKYIKKRNNEVKGA